MTRNRLLLTVALCGLAALAWAQTRPVMPNRSEVVLIAKVLVQPGIDTGFFLNYVEARRRATAVTTAYAELYAASGNGRPTEAAIGPLNQFGYLRFTVPRDRRIALPGLIVKIVNSDTMSIHLPLDLAFTVPEDTPFVYLGTFVYRYSGFYFTPVSFERIDEFDEALAELRAALGPGVRLSRAAFTAHNP